MTQEYIDESERPQGPKSLGDILKTRSKDIHQQPWSRPQPSMETIGERKEAPRPDTPTASGKVSPSFEKYTQVYFDVIAKYDLAPTTALLLFTVRSLSRNKDGYCYMSKKKLSSLLNISEDTLFTHINILEKKVLLDSIPPKYRSDTSKLKLKPHIAEFIKQISNSITTKYRYGKSRL